eukprot:TRINITY_DN1814_c0_g1_i4.p1 TRINITY_DN1814_c0_g1~~TRINITY_DN1814_c0_g1_i4.p1  ORF type:complete len:1627 (-),score=534.96 TRINITY_DN1814_c0_g1_i4:46-4926(-)
MDSRASVSSKKEVLQRSGKVPGFPKSGKKGKNPSGQLQVDNGQVINKLHPKELRQLLGKSTYPSYLDFSPLHFQLDEDDFLQNCPNCVKEMDLSSNQLVECTNLSHLSKMKRLWIDNNLLCNIVFKGMSALEYLSLSQNRIENLNDMADLKKLVNLDLSGNRLTGSFNELSKLKSLKVLDIGTNSIDLAIHEFYNYVLVHIKKLGKLEMVNFSGNPIEDKIREFRHFIVNELPKLKYLDWDLISKDDRTRAHKLEAEGVWDDHLLPIKSQDVGVRQEGAGRTTTAAIVSKIADASSKSASMMVDEGDDRDAKARMLEMLLDDDSDNEFDMQNADNNVFTKSVPGLHVTLEDLIGGKDHLDDILNQLSNNSQVTLNNSSSPVSSHNTRADLRKSKGSNPPLPTFEGLPPMPEQNIERLPDQSKVDAVYLDLLNDMLANDSQLEKETQEIEVSGSGLTPASESDVNYLDMLYEMIQYRDESASLAVATPFYAAPIVPSASATAAPPIPPALPLPEVNLQGSPSPRSASPRNLEPVLATPRSEPKQDTNYLDILDEMMIKRSESQRLEEVRAASRSIQLEDIENTIKDLEESMKQGSIRKSTRLSSPVITTTGPGKESPSPAKAAPTLAKESPSLAKESPSLAKESPSLAKESPSPAKESPSPARVTPAAKPAERDTSKTAPKPEVPIPVKDQVSEFDWETHSRELHYRTKLGDGSFGETWKGIWKGRETTLKKIHTSSSGLSSIREVVQSVREETKNLIHVRADNICTVMGCCILPEADCAIVGEYVSGMNLQGLIHNRSIAVDVPFVVKIARGIAIGLAFLHSTGIIHRSLTSKNVMLDGSFNVKLKDFGYCEIKDSVQTEHGIEYKAPELLTFKPYDEKVDVYSFAILLWEMFVRENPFPGFTAKQIITAIAHDNLRPTLPDCPFVFSKLMEASWNALPDKRPPSEVIVKILSQPLEKVMEYGPKGANTPTSSPGPLRPRPTKSDSDHSSLRTAALNRANSSNETKAPASPKTRTEPAKPAAPTSPAPAAAFHPPIVSRSSIDLLDTDHYEKLLAVVARVKDLLSSPSDQSQLRGANAVLSIAKDPNQIPEIVHSGIMALLKSLINSKLENVQEHVLQTLILLSEHDECNRGFCECGGIETVMRTLYSPNEGILLAASKLLTRLARDDSAKNEICETGLNPFIDLLKLPNEFIQIQTAWAFSLLLEKEHIQDEFITMNGLSPLLKLLLSQNTGLQIRTLTALGHLIKNPKAQDRILKAGVLTRFVDLINSPSPLLQLLALRSVADFIDNSRIRDEMATLTIVHTLLKLLASNNEQIMQCVGKILVYLLQNESQAEHFRSLAGIPSVLRLLSNKNEGIRTQMFLIVETLAANDMSRSVISSLGGLQMILSAVAAVLEEEKKPDATDEVEFAAVSSLEPFIYDDANWTAIIGPQGSGIELLLSYLSSGSARTKRKSVHILSELAQEALVQEVIVRRYGVPVLINLLSSTDPETREYAITCISYISDNKTQRSALCADNGIAAIVPLLRGDSAEAERALWTVANLAQDVANQGELIQSELLANIVGQTLVSDNDGIRSLSLKTLLILAQNATNKAAIVGAGMLAPLQKLSSSPLKPVQLASQRIISFLS